ncbi:MAG: SDR family oxidoreductase [Phycisphaerales bacterium]|nr:SDR family oxidoreductase [Phycisphaerales bacterium]
MNERWLITGASGQLGGHVILRCQARSATAICTIATRAVTAPGDLETESVDLANESELVSCVRRFHPNYLIHLGAMTSVADCHTQPVRAAVINTYATAILADITAEIGARLVFASTDMVFDGEHAPYDEVATPAPLSHYGRTKAAAETALYGRRHVVIVRLPLMYGWPATPRRTTFVQQMEALRATQPVQLFADEFRTPIWLGDAATALVALARSDFSGVIHLPGPERLSRFELVARCAAILGLHNKQLIPCSRHDVASSEPRPADLSLHSNLLAKHFPQVLPGPIRPVALAS